MKIPFLLKGSDKSKKEMANYSGKNIHLILMNALKKLPENKYLFLLGKLKKTKNLSLKIKALKGINYKEKIGEY